MLIIPGVQPLKYCKHILVMSMIGHVPKNLTVAMFLSIKPNLGYKFVFLQYQRITYKRP